jgi:hypothetical protein
MGGELAKVAGTPDLSRDERAELERLRAQVTEMRGQGAREGARRRIGWRTPVATFLILVGCLLAPVSVLAVWSANQVSDTNRYVANVEPLVHDPAIQRALTDDITNQITSHLNVTRFTDQAASSLSARGLPQVGSLLKSFGPSLASTVGGVIHSRVQQRLTSPRFATLWVQVNTVAHQEVVKALSGGGGAVSTSNGQVTVDLAPFVAVVKQDLAGRGLTLVNSLPPIHPTLVLFSSRELVKAQTAYRLINGLKIVLPVLTLVLIGAGVYVARGHRRALIAAGLGFAASMLVLGAGLLIFRTMYLNSVPASVLPSDAAAAMFDTFVRFIKGALRTLLIVGLVVAAGAFMTGPSVTAVRTRKAIASGLARVRAIGERKGLTAGPAGQWTYSHRTGLRISAVGLAAVIFVFWGRPTALVVILLTVILLVILGLIELIGRPPARPQTAGQ